MKLLYDFVIICGFGTPLIFMKPANWSFPQEARVAMWLFKPYFTFSNVNFNNAFVFTTMFWAPLNLHNDGSVKCPRKICYARKTQLLCALTCEYLHDFFFKFYYNFSSTETKVGIGAAVLFPDTNPAFSSEPNDTVICRPRYEPVISGIRNASYYTAKLFELTTITWFLLLSFTFTMFLFGYTLPTFLHKGRIQ